MENTLKLSFPFPGDDKADMIVAELASTGFTGFETTENHLQAFIPEKEFDAGLFKDVCRKYGVTAEQTIIPHTNWNEIWESGFEPVLVDDFCSIRAVFHEPVHHTKHELIITPKMSFGTGHHATTYMMVQLMRDVEFAGKTTFDFGSGTGVLAILAEKMGAVSVLAIDNDEQCMENAAENIVANGCRHIQTQKYDRVPEGEWDLILANINLNVLCKNMPGLGRSLAKGGKLLLSGILETDIPLITQVMAENGLKVNRFTTKNGWAALEAG
jgi:ribosomal protein L11 methyltransferase